jgi:hypothetical protein
MLAIPRQLRIQYEGATYHLMSRGDRREEIFRDDPFSINAILPIAPYAVAAANSVELGCLRRTVFH